MDFLYRRSLLPSLGRSLATSNDSALQPTRCSSDSCEGRGRPASASGRWSVNRLSQAIKNAVLRAEKNAARDNGRGRDNSGTRIELGFLRACCRVQNIEATVARTDINTATRPVSYTHLRAHET